MKNDRNIQDNEKWEGRGRKKVWKLKDEDVDCDGKIRQEVKSEVSKRKSFDQNV